MPAKPKSKAPLLQHLAGTTSDAPPPPPPNAGKDAGAPSDAQGRQDAGAPSGFTIEVLSVEEAAEEIVAIESGRGQVIRAKSKDVEILDPAPGSKHKRVRLQPGKFKYE